MNRLARWAAITATAGSLFGLGGCTTTSLMLSAAGVASDTSMTWEIVKHVHAKLTEGDPVACSGLDSVERALSPRCGTFVSGSLKARDLAASPFGACALTVAARDPRLWPALPELLDVGARAQTCSQSPVVALAQANDCPSLESSSSDVRDALMTLAQNDPRAVHHDVVRWLSCPASRTAGLDGTLSVWLDNGLLEPGKLSFSPLSALHPSDIGSPISAALEARGHTADAALDGFQGERAPGFDEALRTSDWAALDWWLARMPRLANQVPNQQLGWVPLARVLTPGFLAYPASQSDLVNFLLAHGADPRARLPANPSQSVIAMARTMNSPLLGTLEAAAAQKPAETGNIVASSNRALRLIAR